MNEELDRRLADVGEFIKNQREVASMSVRRLANLANISNPYLSQIERGLKRPSAEILQQIAKGLKVSAESLYVRAGILDERSLHGGSAPGTDVLSAIAADPRLTDRQRGVLVEIYRSFVGTSGDGRIDPSEENPRTDSADVAGTQEN